MGQWREDGMIMVGDMFNQGLRARVDALCTELAALLRSQPSVVATTPSQSQSQSQSGGPPGVSLFVPGARQPEHGGLPNWAARPAPVLKTIYAMPSSRQPAALRLRV